MVFLRIIFCISVLVFFLSCNESTTETTLTSYTITGNVQDLDGYPLNDVDVYFVYHLNDLPAKGLSEIVNGDSLYQNFPNPFSDSTSIRFETYRSIRYEVKLFDYYYITSSILLEGSCSPGTVEVTFGNFHDYPNGGYKIGIRYLINFTTRYDSEIDILINRTDPVQLKNSKANVKVINGQFNANLSRFPLRKIINCTDAQGSNTAIKQISNLMTFVLLKDGYKPLQVDYFIDSYKQNKITFKMEKN